MKMKNKIELKKMLCVNAVVVLIFLTVFSLLNLYQYCVYMRNYNQKLTAVFSKVLEEYPRVSKLDLVTILNQEEPADHDLLREYGIDIREDSFILNNENCFKRFAVVNLSLLALFSVSLLTVFLKYNREKDRKLAEITQYIRDINKGNYRLRIDDNTEDELSILKNEIYKITVMLKGQAEHSLADKRALKDSLSDISHQLKTPFTSILIMLDNISDDPDMEAELRGEFIEDIRKKIRNVNFLVQSILKLSRFDANTVSFHNSEVPLSELVQGAIDNVSVLCDLKEVNISVTGSGEEPVFCDARWQVEALTNLLKNAIEHLQPSGSILITLENNKLYSQIEIRDNGSGIAPEDMEHIFERFYRGKSFYGADTDNAGIGLALSRAIIRQNNGSISVDSQPGEGTVFVVRYEAARHG